MNTRGRILNLLNRQPCTVQELAATLGISRNSTHLQISRLEAGGLVVKGEQRRVASGAGKPAFEYRLAQGAEDAYSAAHKPVLDALLQTIATQLPAAGSKALLRGAGQQMAVDANLQASGTPEADLQKALTVVNSLGAMAEISRFDSNLCVTSHSCPIASMVHSQPDSCELVAQFFAHATGRPVQSKCQRKAGLICRFVVKT